MHLHLGKGCLVEGGTALLDLIWGNGEGDYYTQESPARGVGALDSVEEVVRPVPEAVQIIEGSLGSQCLVWLFQVHPQGFQLLHVDARNLCVHLVDNCPACVSLCHGLLHGRHYHLEQGAPEGSHQPPSASTDACHRDRPDHDVCQHPGDSYQEQH
jgi:hypothetical protein